MTKSNHKDSIVSQENETINSVAPIEDATQPEVEEIDYSVVCSGPLYFDKRNLKPGYVPCWVGDLPGQIEMYKKWGYEIVHDQFKVGDSNASTTSQFGSAVTVASKCGQTMVLMAIKEALHKKLMAYRQNQNNKMYEGLGHIDGIPAHLQELHGEKLSHFTSKTSRS